VKNADAAADVARRERYNNPVSHHRENRAHPGDRPAAISAAGCGDLRESGATAWQLAFNAAKAVYVASPAKLS